MVIRGEITEKKLEHIYITINNIIKNQDCYYTKEEIYKLKQDSKNIFLKGGGNNGKRKR